MSAKKAPQTVPKATPMLSNSAVPVNAFPKTGAHDSDYTSATEKMEWIENSELEWMEKFPRFAERCGDTEFAEQARTLKKKEFERQAGFLVKNHPIADGHDEPDEDIPSMYEMVRLMKSTDTDRLVEFVEMAKDFADDGLIEIAKSIIDSRG